MSKVSIHRAGAADAATVAHFVHALLDELSGGQAPASETVVQSAESVLSEASVVAMLAWSDGEPLGVIVLNECAAIYAGGKFGEISELYVRPDRRSQGVAPCLIESAQAEGKRRGWTRLEVGAPKQPEWKRTLDFYLRSGFEEVGPRLRRLL